MKPKSDYAVTPELAERVESLIERIPFHSCWEWGGRIAPNGYGVIEVHTVDNKRRSRRAHRIIYESYVGAIPDGLQLDHLCRNRGCVNPAHLEPVTNHENHRRGLRASKTHCPAGHAYSGDNLVLTKRGRKCRACNYKHGRTFAERHPGHRIGQRAAKRAALDAALSDDA
jgi:5-methylcytosine-specific restriction endonuclease McrA